MKCFPIKRKQLAIGVSIAALSLAILNYAQLNSDAKAPSLVTVKDAHADYVCYAIASQICQFWTDDGLNHILTNAENTQ